jgi:hypothetical protein
LANIYSALNPVTLQEQIFLGQRQLAKLGERTPTLLPTIDGKSVTSFMKQLVGVR